MRDRSARRRLPWLVDTIGLVAASALAVVIVAKARGGSEPVETAAPIAPEVTKPVVLPDPVLRITTTPPGAMIHVDGPSKGRAPVRMPIARGTRVVIAADHDGFEPVSQTIEMGSNDQTFALALVVARAAVIDAGVPIDVPGSSVTKPTRPGRPTKSATGSAAFNPNEVGGD